MGQQAHDAYPPPPWWRGPVIKMMVQYDARGYFVRRAQYNGALYAIWSLQIPFGRIEVQL